MIETNESFLARMLILLHNGGTPTGSDAIRLQDLANGHHQVPGIPDEFAPPTSTELQDKPNPGLDITRAET
jgi:hypothetical protein